MSISRPSFSTSDAQSGTRAEALSERPMTTCGSGTSCPAAGLARPFSLTRTDLFVLLGLLVYAFLVHVGRVGDSLDGLDLATDPAMYAAIAAAWDNPANFAADAVFSNPAFFATHVTLVVKLAAFFAEDGNYALGYLKITGAVLFLHLSAYYLLGRLLFGQRWKALVFCLLMSLCYWTPWGTYWGAGYRDYTPRTLFDAFFGLLLCALFHVRQRPVLWLPFMFAAGLLVHVHSVSALPAAAGFWLCFAANRPKDKSMASHLTFLVLAGLMFLLPLAPYALVYLGGGEGMQLSADDVAFMDRLTRLRFSPEYADWRYGMAKFYKQYTLNLVLPLALFSTWVLLRHGDSRERLVCKHLYLLVAGVYLVLALYVADQEISHSLGRMPLEMDLGRVHRFLAFYGIALALLAANHLLRRFTQKGCGRILARVFALGLVLGLFLGSQQDMVRSAARWYWASLDENRYQAVYGEGLLVRELVEAVEKHVAPGESVFLESEMQAIRSIAHRSLTWCIKDACLFYYPRAVKPLEVWTGVTLGLGIGRTAPLDAALATNADFLVSESGEDRAFLESLGHEVVWENNRYLLVRIRKV